MKHTLMVSWGACNNFSNHIWSGKYLLEFDSVDVQQVRCSGRV